MMNATTRARRPFLFGIALLLALLQPLPLLPQAQADSTISSAVELSQLAEQGRFDQVLSVLRTTPAANDDEVASLIKDIERFEAARASHAADQQAAFDKAYATMVERIGVGRHEDAVVSAIEANSLAKDSKAFLADEKVTSLLRGAESAAAAAEEEGRWVDAMSLYRAMDMLFDDHATYYPSLKRTGKHVRVLRLYTPVELEKQLKVRAERLKGERAADRAKADAEAEAKGEEKLPAKDPEIRLDKESWEQKLADIELPMLRQTLAQAARRHVSTRGYADMLRGAIDSLDVLANTPTLDQTFPGIANADRKTAFHDGLKTLRAEVDKSPDNVNNFLDAASVIDRIVSLNAKTLELPEPVLVFEMSEGATETLDEFSAVIWPREVEGFSRNFQGKFFGVGIQISQRDDRLVVVSPLEGTPAQKAGIKAGDAIVTVDGEDTTGWNLEQAVRRITGEKDTVVVLGVERVGQEGPLEFSLTRAEIAIESIRGWQHRSTGGWDYYIDPERRIGYVRLQQFIPQSADDLDAAINQMQQEGGLNGLVLDLRFNPGGLLSSAVDVVNRFVPSGPIVSTVGPDNARGQEYKANPKHAHAFFPVVVLINQGSASASEIVSGALQDYDRAVIIGTRSFGKGSVQDVLPIDGGKAFLKLTTQYYKLPQGRIIHRQPQASVWGVEPDLIVKMTDEQVLKSIEFRQDVDVLRDADAVGDDGKPLPTANEILTQSLDPQLQAALLVLKTRLVAQDIAVAQRPEPARNP